MFDRMGARMSRGDECRRKPGPSSIKEGPIRGAMMVLTFYHYPKCSTCIKARKHLVGRGYALNEIDVTINPPSAATLKMLIERSHKPYTAFLNTSGIQYREQKMSEKVKTAPEEKIVEMLGREGRLLKRPIVTDGKRVTVGYKPDEFDAVWSTVS
jgi:arsenate reductase (glutaredoxin)